MSDRTIERMSGLDDLFGQTEANPTPQATLPIEQIVLPESQPRRYFDTEKLESLANSIKEVGLLEPIVVRPIGDNTYELIAGERRLRACQIAKLENIAVNIIECDDTAANRIRLVENLQREDLNVYEETTAILELLALLLDYETEEVVSILYRMQDEEKGKVPHNVMGSSESLTVQELFSKLGKITWQSFVSNRLPVLKLKDDIKEVLSRGELEYTKALAISKIKNDEKRAEVLKQAIGEKLSLSKIKELVENALLDEPKKKEKPLPSKKEVSSRLSRLNKAVKDSNIWDKPRELKELVKALTQIEKLLAGTKISFEGESLVEDNALEMQLEEE
ncbi:ParB/RepB/Spo0J family partition protein [Scytonema sp. UIC 10036]|uniref:ParB/RepB/Spo0J family partition protein n=1 Tax=Scytonema sp. UIC 10036 TaxID=2304196 RepID=UPI0012DA549F|nr:ParB/RepB/Spo0J family partition protein [Scytonema sp. UIC 10036]MUG91693.1 ParB/RepB/Spo0J family partition protein [Scytonema sp. UIC 10036]